jgi:hypothetical protein
VDRPTRAVPAPDVGDVTNSGRIAATMIGTFQRACQRSRA